MVEKTAGSILGLKVSAPGHRAGADRMSAGKALRRSLSRAADGLWSLEADARVECDKVLPQEDCSALLRRGDLFLLIRNAAGQSGLAVFDPPFVNSVIEVQTLGRVLPIECEERDFTRTDAAMIAPLLDTALPQLGGMTGQGNGFDHLAGYSFVQMVEDVHAASLLLDAPRYDVIDLSCRLSDGVRDGRAVFLFPRFPESTTAETDKEKAGRGAGTAALEMAPAEMKAVLFRVRLPLSRISSLSEGEVFTCPASCVESAELMAKGSHLVTTAKLGQLNGMRAVRLHSSLPAPEDHPNSEPVQTPGSPIGEAPPSAESSHRHLAQQQDTLPDIGHADPVEINETGELPPVDPALQDLPPEI